jgi:hypothetical protein
LMIKKSRLSKTGFLAYLRELSLQRESSWTKSSTHLEKDWLLDRSTGFWSDIKLNSRFERKAYSSKRRKQNLRVSGMSGSSEYRFPVDGNGRVSNPEYMKNSRKHRRQLENGSHNEKDEWSSYCS